MTRKFSGFNASGSDEVTNPEASVAKIKKEPKFFSVGLHTVKIASVDEKGEVASDSSWERLWLRLEGTGEKSTFTGVAFPTESLLFKGEANSYPAQLFLQFVQALGYSTTPSALPGVMAKLFSDTSKLVGLELQVQVGYKKSHIVVQDKKLHIMQKYGNKPVLKDGQPAVFNEREEAHQWAESVKLDLQKFPEVVAFIPAETKKTVTTVVKSESNRKAF
jgi:hypothetical protein